MIAQQDPPPNTNPEEEGGENTEQEKNPPVNVVDRGYDTSGDISNRRFDVWKGGFELFADSPRSILFGYSFKGFTEQAKEVQPDNYLVDNDYAQFTTLDNEVVNILVSQGLFGIVAFGAFVVAILIFCFKRLFKLKKEKQLLSALLVAVLFGLSLSAMFCSVMFYHLSVNTVLFWCFLGYLVHMLNKAEKEQTNEQ
jgi:O-antigen ligase